MGAIIVAALLLAAFPQAARAADRDAPLPAHADLGPMRHLWQSLNSCGPAAVVMALSMFGVEADQEVARLALRGPDVQQLIGPDWTESGMRDGFYTRAKADAYAQDTSAAWLAYGEAAYQDGWFAEAVAAFDRGMSLGSVVGVFTVRSSYPQALRALGHQNDANNAAASLATLSATPSTVVQSPDRYATFMAYKRAHQENGVTLVE